MWSFGHTVREIERSHKRVVIEETATTGGAWIFGGLTLLTLFLWVTRPWSSSSTFAEESVGAFAVLFFQTLALYSSVRSRYTADRSTGQLVTERSLFSLTKSTVYDAHSINRIYIRHTMKGSGLYLRLTSRHKKRLSWSMEFVPLEGFAESLNFILHRP